MGKLKITNYYFFFFGMSILMIDLLLNWESLNYSYRRKQTTENELILR